MLQSKMLRATVGSFLVMFTLSFLWYGILAEGYNARQYMMILRGPEDFSFLNIAIGYILLAGLLSYAYPLGYSGGRSGSQGLRFGILMGLVIALPAAFINGGAYKMPLMANLVDALYRVVEIGLGGLIIGRLYGADAAGQADE